jgi:2-polyprenyl-6-methoxyphenol hydroxylase-like FAD-dependent oxidoreductase
MVPRLLLALLISSACAVADEKSRAIEALIPWLLQDAETFRRIPFPEVIAVTSGRKVLPVDRAAPDDQRILAAIGGALDAVLAEMNDPASPVRAARRVNEMSSHFETALRRKLSALPGIACDFPKTAAGVVQRSGYPDLRLADKATGRVFYLDPKLYARSSRASTLRTFYFEPRRETNKVTEDAHHLILGIEHERDGEGTVRFRRWELVDLAHFRVTLKAEFHGSNADLYRPEAIVGEGKALDPE